MEAEEIQQAPACKFPRVGNGRNDSSKIGSKGGSDHYPDDEEDGELNRACNVVPGSDAGGNANRLRGWNHSRIIRVSRASGGKDRHSKVWTSKGLRDRRVRLSVNTAIQFYDLQDRLGHDQPSKAVEWLIKAAADAIAELPSLNSSFPDTPKQLSDEKRASGGTEQGFDSAEVELDGDPNFQQNQSQHLSLSKSACSSTSETSKGSGLSLSRSEIRVKARERARERAAKEKEKENDSRVAQNVNHMSHNASFTELLTGGISSVNNNGTSPTGSTHQNPCGESNLFHKAAARQWTCSTPMDYVNSGLLGPSSRAHHSSGFSGQSHLGNSIPQAMTMSVPTFNISGDNHSELQHFPFVPDHLIPVAAATSQPGSGPVDYNLNFSISSSGLAGYNRGTLQSNSSSFFPHLQRFSPIDGPNVPFFMASTASASPPMENHHPDTPKRLSDEKRASGGTEQGFDSAEVEVDGDLNFQQNQSQHLSLSKSACSSTSETSKGSGSSLSRSETRVKAREWARERAAKEREKENDSGIAQNVNHISHNTSFTELLTGGISSVNNNATIPIEWTHQNPGGDPNVLHKAARQWSCTIPMDYSESGILGPSSGVQHSSGFSGHIPLGNSIPQVMTTSAVNANTWDRMKCFKASSPGSGFCPSSTNKLLPGECLVSNRAVKGLCHGEDRKWFTRGCPRNMGWLTLVGLITFCTMFFSSGTGIVPRILNPEIYPLSYRGICGGIAASANWISNLIVPQSFLTLTHAFGSSWTFLIFLAISVVALLFSLINVPETKGLPI